MPPSGRTLAFPIDSRSPGWHAGLLLGLPSLLSLPRVLSRALSPLEVERRVRSSQVQHLSGDNRDHGLCTPQAEMHKGPCLTVGEGLEEGLELLPGFCLLVEEHVERS